MWLLPAFPAVSRTALRIYYRLRSGGAAVPDRGAVLLVANHPNSLLDPALVVVAAGRPVRFLAKAPLFTDPLVGWLIRGAGAIPVHRRQDDPSQMQRNDDAFGAAHEALRQGDAVGIFPEGLSHDEPALAPLRTGAARIALGAARARGGTFPIIPVGLVLRDKGVFRSEALVLVGAPVEWADLAAAGDTKETVEALTARIDDGLRDVTINLDRWEDAPLVETAEAIWAAERDGSPADADQVRRLRLGTQRLAQLRRGDAEWQALARRILRHHRVLRRLGLTPRELQGDPGYRDAMEWTLRRVPMANLAAFAIGGAGALLFWPPYRLTGVAAQRMSKETNLLSTTKLLTGIPIYAAWVAALAVIAGLALGPVAAVASALLLPPLAAGTLQLREGWREGRRDFRRFLLKRTRRQLVADLRSRQSQLGSEIDAFFRSDPAPALPSEPL
jgi:glycerol-3-phosphate O-acyltransferase / dihydroxyacetone phosphate acyltransferase